MKKIKLPKFTPWMAWISILTVFLAGGVTAGIMVLWKGLWLTNLSDKVPWGLWITIDLSSIAVSAGAFSLCAVVYLLGLKRYQAVARTATFIGLIGYTMAVLTLLLDIGRPDRFWHSMIYWNKHSLLWEVTMCVTLYLAVLALEALPIFAGFSWLRSHFPKLAAKMSSVHHFAPYLAIAGLALSMLHQSSLGALYGVLKARPLWYRPDISVLFIISAIAAGMALTVFSSMISARLTNHANVDNNVLDRVAHIIGWVLVVYLYFRFWDALSMTYTYEPGRTEGLQMLTGGALSFNFWIGEILLGAVIPIILLLNKRTRCHASLEDARHGFGGWRSGCVPVGYKPIGIADLPFLPPRRTLGGVCSIYPIIDRSPDRCRDHQLRFAGFLPGSQIPESCGPQCCEHPCGGTKGGRSNPCARRLVFAFENQMGPHPW